MKKVVLSAIALLVATQTVNAIPLVDNALNTAGNLGRSAVNAPGDVLGRGDRNYVDQNGNQQKVKERRGPLGMRRSARNS